LAQTAGREAPVTSISTAATAEISAMPKVKSRNLALDRARTFLTLVVLFHHAVIPYTYFGHTDPKSWIGFDMVVLATDSFFMAMFFFLSGLFVWPGLGHKSPGIFLRDRLLRLGLPFAIAAFTVIPVAYYAISLRQHPEIGFSEFWWKMVTIGPWPSGPIWFVWVLLAFDLTASLLYRVSAHLVDPINRMSQQGFDRPAIFFLFLLGVSVAVYIPAVLYFGPSHWFEFGPFSVQASRLLLYAAYFFVGAGIGAANFERGVLGADGARRRQPARRAFRHRCADAARGLQPERQHLVGQPRAVRQRVESRGDAEPIPLDREARQRPVPSARAGLRSGCQSIRWQLRQRKCSTLQRCDRCFD
jgi:hypothetical protein